MSLLYIYVEAGDIASKFWAEEYDFYPSRLDELGSCFRVGSKTIQACRYQATRRMHDDRLHGLDNRPILLMIYPPIWRLMRGSNGFDYKEPLLWTKGEVLLADRRVAEPES